MENIKDYQQYLRGYNYTGVTPVIIDFYAHGSHQWNGRCYMKIIGNIIWIIFGGLHIALEYFIAGLVLMITIIGIPFGKMHSPQQGEINPSRSAKGVLQVTLWDSFFASGEGLISCPISYFMGWLVLYSVRRLMCCFRM